MFISYIQNSNKRIYLKYTPEEISEFKKKIKSEFYSFFDSNIIKNNINIKEGDSFILSDELSEAYYSRYTQYILYSFNSTIVNMIIVYFNKNKEILEIYRLEENFIYNSICLLKNLLMNEIEVSYFTLLFDKMGFKCEKIDYMIYLTILGIITKKSLSKDNEYTIFINIFSKKYPKFEETYLNYISDEKIVDKIAKNNINIKLINKRFIELTKPVNSYCRKNYIILEGLIDKIVYLCQPYDKKEIKDSINTSENNIILNEDIISYINNMQKEINFENIRDIGNDDNFNDIIVNGNNCYENLISSSINLDDIYEK